jgi:ABC-type Na+ efflux pump permease subunit
MHTHDQHRPYWHSLAFATIWYAAIVLLNTSHDNAGEALVLGAVPWLGTSIALWRVAHGGMKAWRLILLGLPIFYFLWALTVVVVARFIVPITG